MAGGTNFESIDHARLKAMIEHSDPSKVFTHGSGISEAAAALDEISQALASHLSRLEWEGEAADAFRQFATKVYQSAGAISEYSRVTGDVVQQVGQALFDAKNGLPDVPQDDIAAVSRHKGQPNTTVKVAGGILGAPLGVFGIGAGAAAADKVADKLDPNWVTDAEAKAAQQRVNLAHQQAIHEMERLAQTYSMATTQLNALEAPVVGPQPITTGIGGGSENVVIGGGGEVSGSGGGSGGSGGGSGRGVGSIGGGSGGGGGGGVGSIPTPYHPTPPRQTTPWKPDPVQPWTPPSTPPRGTQDPGFQVPPSVGTHPPRTGIDSLPTYPDTANPPHSGYTPGGGTGGSTNPGGGTGGGTHAGGGGLGGGYVPSGGIGGSRGTSSLGGGSIPGRSGTGTTGGGVAGRSGTAGGTGAGSSAFGAKEGQAGRAAGAGGMGGGGMHGGGGGAGGGGAAGGSRGRGLTSTAGGTVGGRKGPGTAGEFTAGGTGLRNRAAAAGGAGAAAGAAGGTGRGGQGGMPGGQGGAGKSERERRNRADYLHEDEETWTNGTPQSNPNVIE